MAYIDELSAAFSAYAAGNWDQDNWQEFGRETGASDILKRHPRLYRSLSFGDPDYIDAVMDVAPVVLKEAAGNSIGEKMQLLADFAPDMVGWVAEHGVYRTKKRFAAMLKENLSEVPAEWASDVRTFIASTSMPSKKVHPAEPPTELADSPSDTNAAPASASVPRTSNLVSDKPTRSGSRTVFIVHGRNTAVRDQLELFLRHIGVTAMTWTDAAKAVGKTMPTTLEIVRAGINSANAVIVIFSPDDEAKLKNDFIQKHDGDQERFLTGQARQNVILEAGMAMAIAPTRTIFVRVGRPRTISDIEGINWIDIDDHWDSRKRLLNELEHAGIVTSASDLNLTARLAGKFESVELGDLSSITGE